MSDKRLPVGTRVIWKRQSTDMIWEDVIQEYSPSGRYVCMDEEEWVDMEDLMILEVLPPKEQPVEPAKPRQGMPQATIPPLTEDLVPDRILVKTRRLGAEQALREVRWDVGNWMKHTRHEIREARGDDALKGRGMARYWAFDVVNRLLRDKLKEVRGE